jgi:hypothetical protein
VLDKLPLRARILAKLVSYMTVAETGWHGKRVRSADDVLDILNHMEMSDWWISKYANRPVVHFGDNTSLFKTLLVRYLDPRMPKSRAERVARFAHLVPPEMMLPFLDYLTTIDNPDEDDGIRQMISSLTAKEDDTPGDSSD